MPKKKPCEFCEMEGNIAEDAVNNLQLTIESYPYNNFIGICLTGLDANEREVEINFEIPLNYCPNCGRKLN